jgi:hypothetical protein
LAGTPTRIGGVSESLTGGNRHEYLDAMGDGSAGLFGRFAGPGEPFVHRAGDDIMVDVPLHWEAGDAKGIVRFDQDGRVAGLAIRPA